MITVEMNQPWPRPLIDGETYILNGVPYLYEALLGSMSNHGKMFDACIFPFGETPMDSPASLHLDFHADDLAKVITLLKAVNR